MFKTTIIIDEYSYNNCCIIFIDFLKQKTCILITHQIQYLADVDQIVLMENVRIDYW